MPDQRPDAAPQVPLSTLKASLIVMHSLVVSGLTLMLLAALLEHNKDVIIVAILMLIEINSFVAIAAAYKESRPLLLITGSITLVLFVLAMFAIEDRLNTIFPFLYILASVGMSFAMAGMIRSREHMMILESRGSQTESMRSSFTDQFPHIISYQSGEHSTASDSPPDYETVLATGGDSPPKYEDAVRGQCV